MFLLLGPKTVTSAFHGPDFRGEHIYNAMSASDKWCKENDNWARGQPMNDLGVGGNTNARL